MTLPNAISGLLIIVVLYVHVRTKEVWTCFGLCCTWTEGVRREEREGKFLDFWPRRESERERSKSYGGVFTNDGEIY